jgi:hypothetical protein
MTARARKRPAFHRFRVLLLLLPLPLYPPLPLVLPLSRLPLYCDRCCYCYYSVAAPLRQLISEGLKYQWMGTKKTCVCSEDDHRTRVWMALAVLQMSPSSSSPGLSSGASRKDFEMIISEAISGYVLCGWAYFFSPVVLKQ